MSVFDTLNQINVSEHTEQKGNLTYLSWVWAWAELKKRYPKSNYTIYEDRNGCMYHTDGRTAWVKVGVTVVDGDYAQEHIEILHIMDYKNNSLPLDKVTSKEAQKTIQRALTKAIARHGLGLYIFAGEDLPECEQGEKPDEKPDEQPPMTTSEKVFRGLEAKPPQGTVAKSETMGPIEAVPMDNRRLLKQWADGKGLSAVQVGDMIKFLADEGIVPDAKNWPNMGHDQFTSLMYKLDTFKGGGSK